MRLPRESDRGPEPWQLRWRRGAVAALALAFGSAHIAAIYTENINWDEFALLQRVSRMLQTGAVQGGGRPGAIELVLAPIVRGCVHAVDTLCDARLLGALMTLLGLSGLYTLVRSARRERADPGAGALLAVALLALALPFLRWSLQIRTDQFAIAFGLWGGVALLASRNHRAWSFAAGLLFGTGYLFTQKLLYVLGLCGIVWLGSLPRPIHSELRSRLAALALCGLGAGLVVALYREFVPLLLTLPKSISFEHGLDTMAHYRRVYGTALYRGLVTALVPHGILVAGLLAATLSALRARRAAPGLWLSWALLAAGVAVAAFHAASFPYFWMTLGLFPAVALGLSLEEIAAVVPARVRALTGIAWGAALLVPAALYSATLLEDTQRTQRDALSFIERNFAAEDRGFQLEGALACRRDPDPFKIYFQPYIEADFMSADAERNSAAFFARFRDKPVRFLIFSHMISFFPQPIKQFWRANYQPYHGAVYVAGHTLQGPARTEERWFVFAPGRYRWQALDPRGASRLTVADRELSDGDTLELARGEHSLALVRGGAGRLVLALNEPPLRTTGKFYTPAAVDEIIGRSWLRD